MGLNIINGLDLSHDQMEIILQSAEESKRLREELQKSILLLSDDMETELEKIKSYLKKNQDIPPSTAQRFHRISNEIKEKRKKKRKR